MEVDDGNDDESADTLTAGSRLSATIRAFSSGDQLRRRTEPSITVTSWKTAAFVSALWSTSLTPAAKTLEAIPLDQPITRKVRSPRRLRSETVNLAEA